MNSPDQHTSQDTEAGHDRADTLLAARIDALLQDATEVRDQARFWLSDAYHVLEPDDESYRRALETARSVDGITVALDNVVGHLDLDAYTPEHSDMERGDHDPLLTEIDEGWLPTKVRTELSPAYDPYDPTRGAEALAQDLDEITDGLFALQNDGLGRHDPAVLNDAILMSNDASHGFKSLQARTADGVHVPDGLERDPFEPAPTQRVGESITAAENGLNRIREQHAAGESSRDDDVTRWHVDDIHAGAERSRDQSTAGGTDQEPTF